MPESIVEGEVLKDVAREDDSVSVGDRKALIEAVVDEDAGPVPVVDCVHDVVIEERADRVVVDVVEPLRLNDFAPVTVRDSWYVVDFVRESDACVVGESERDLLCDRVKFPLVTLREKVLLPVIVHEIVLVVDRDGLGVFENVLVVA